MVRSVFMGGDVWYRGREERIDAPKPQEDSPLEIYSQILANPPSRDFPWKAHTIGHHENHVEALKAALRLAADPVSGYRSMGVQALVPLQCRGFMEAYRKLRDMVTDSSEEVRWTLAREIPSAASIENNAILLALACDPAPQVRAEVPSALSSQTTPEARAAFLKLLRDPVGMVRAAASDYLHCLGDVPIRPEEALDLCFDSVPEVRAHVAHWLTWEVPAIAIEPLLNLSNDHSELVRANALDALSHFLTQDPRVLPRILAAFKDMDPNVRIEATRLLHRHPAPEVLAALLACEADSANAVRNFVARGLEGRATLDMLPILERLAEDEGNALTRWATAKALEPLPGPEVETILVNLSRDPKKNVAVLARKILERRAKAGLAAPPTAFELRYGQKDSVATRLAFYGKSAKPLHAWEQFIRRVQHLDGVKNGSTISTPVVVLTQAERFALAILPFGPAHWICLEWTAGEDTDDGPNLGYALRSTEEVEIWAKGLGEVRVVKGRRLAKKLGWVK